MPLDIGRMHCRDFEHLAFIMIVSFGSSELSAIDERAVLPHRCPVAPRGNSTTWAGIPRNIMKKRLTVRGLYALKAAEPGTRTMIWDSEAANFGLRVTETGKASFVVMRRVNGKLIWARRRRVSHRHRMWRRVAYPGARQCASRAAMDTTAGIHEKRRMEIKRREKWSCVRTPSVQWPRISSSGTSLNYGNAQRWPRR